LDELILIPASWKRYMPALELAILDVSRMDDKAMVGDPFLQIALTLLKYVRVAELDAVQRSLFQMLSQIVGLQHVKDLLDTIRVYVMSVNPDLGEEKMNELVSEFWPVQPEPGSVADQLIKKGEARDEARGVASGIAQEKANTIRTLQTILGVPQSADEQLAGKSAEELQAAIESLQQQIARRLH